MIQTPSVCLKTSPSGGVLLYKYFEEESTQLVGLSNYGSYKT
jgi:hypothetical protein